jgi:hypothetical protein
MNLSAELVRSVVRWALVTIATVESARERVPGPRLSQMQLGRMMYRSDMATAIALAVDVGYRTDRDLLTLVTEIKTGWGQDERPRIVRRDGASDAYDAACSLLREIRPLLTEDQERLLTYACVMKTWKALESAFPGRSWSELRRTFETLSEQICDRHMLILSETAELIDRMKKTSR